MRIFCPVVQQKTPIPSKTKVAQTVVTPISSNSKKAHAVFLKLYLRKIWANLKKKTVAQCDLGPISSNRKVAHGV